MKRLSQLASVEDLARQNCETGLLAEANAFQHAAWIVRSSSLNSEAEYPAKQEAINTVRRTGARNSRAGVRDRVRRQVS
jgi:hypothetical protein